MEEDKNPVNKGKLGQHIFGLGFVSAAADYLWEVARQQLLNEIERRRAEDGTKGIIYNNLEYAYRHPSAHAIFERYQTMVTKLMVKPRQPRTELGPGGVEYILSNSKPEGTGSLGQPIYMVYSE